MCYEVFSRSAAETYLRQVRRERYAREKKAASEKTLASVNSWTQQAIRSVDWALWFGRAARLYQRHKPWVLGMVAALGVWMAWTLAHSPSVQLAVGGARLQYAFKMKKMSGAILGARSDFKIWSERPGGGMDTRIADSGADEIATLVLKKSSKTVVSVRPSQWWVEWRHDGKSKGRMLSLDNSSMAPAVIVLDRRGALRQRRYGLETRLARSMPFLAPMFPGRRLHNGERWSETVEWTELIGDWRIHWSADLAWSLQGVVACGDGTCEHLVYDAALHPRLLSGPSWGSFYLASARFSGVGHGEAAFDRRAGQLMSNSFSYTGTFRVPAKDLAQIPKSLRVGRSMRHTPGDIVVDFSNSLNIRKP